MAREKFVGFRYYALDFEGFCWNWEKYDFGAKGLDFDTASFRFAFLARHVIAAPSLLVTLNAN